MYVRKMKWSATRKTLKVSTQLIDGQIQGFSEFYTHVLGEEEGGGREKTHHGAPCSDRIY